MGERDDGTLVRDTAAMWLTVLALAGTGLVAGMFGAMLGLGGGIFLVPALTLLFGLPMRVAVGASLIGVIATSAAVASVSRPGRSADVNLALRLEIASTFGALLGGLLAGRLSASCLMTTLQHAPGTTVNSMARGSR